MLGSSGPRRLRWLAVTLAALAAGTVFFIARQASTTSREIDGLRAELSTVKKRSSLPPVVIREVHMQADRSLPSPSPAESDVSTASAKWHALTHAQKEQHLELVNKTRADVCEKRFAQEVLDPAWSEGAARQIRDKYSGKGFEGLSIATDCRSTLCKIDFSYTESPAGLTAVHDMTSFHPWPTERFTRFDHQTRKGVSYLAREGEELPPVDVALQ